MASKIDNLTELEEVLCNIEKTNKGVLSYIRQFNLWKLFSVFNAVKTKGIGAGSLLLCLCLYRIKGLSIWAMHKRGCGEFIGADENAFYRLMNNPKMNWRKLLMSFARQFIAIVDKKGFAGKEVKCFVLDDTVLSKIGSTFEFISRVHDHVSRQFILGFKLLSLALWDGKSLIALDFSMHREKGSKGNYGLSKKEKTSQFRKKRENKSPAKQRASEVDMKKNEVAVSMIKRAIKNGIHASYVLMDSWFTCDYTIKAIRSIKGCVLNVIGMVKMDKRKYLIDNKELNAHQIIIRKKRKACKYSRKYKSHYIPVVVDYKGEKVKLFLIQYRNSKKWTLLLSTDLMLGFTKALELYQIRWTIEVMFKECKQYLSLGKCQNTDFDGQIADATLVFVTHTILSLQKRFGSYETLGGLFREAQSHLLELSLWQRILKIFINALRELMELFDIEMDQILEKLIQDKKTNKQILAILELMIKDDIDDNSLEKMTA